MERYFERKATLPLQLEVVFNAAPTMLLPVVRQIDGKLTTEAMRWGFVPTWWKKEAPPSSTINARLEDAATKPMWRDAIKRSRALVPAVGYFEWMKTEGPKQPYFIRLAGQELMCFAGVWSSWRPSPDVEAIETFAILTTAAVDSVVSIHHRMPVVLPEEAWHAWTDLEQCDGAVATTLAQATAQGGFESYPVSTYVNSPRNQGKLCIEPLASQ